jgi:hypothetical protein
MSRGQARVDVRSLMQQNVLERCDACSVRRQVNKIKIEELRIFSTLFRGIYLQHGSIGKPSKRSSDAGGKKLS